MKVTITKPELFAAVCRFVGKEETRYYLKGVHVGPAAMGGLLIIATDGHRLFAAYDENGTWEGDASTGSERCPDYIFAPHTAKQPKKHFDADTLVLDGSTATYIGPKGPSIVQCGSTSCEYPHWARVMPSCHSYDDHATLQEASFNGEYVSDFCEVRKLLGADLAFVVHHTGGNPALVSMGRSDCVGVIMPMRVGGRGVGSMDTAYAAKAAILSALDDRYAGQAIAAE